MIKIEFIEAKNLKTANTFNIRLIKNATTAWKLFSDGKKVEDALIIQFCKDYLESKKAKLGEGCFITIDPAVEDFRALPYSSKNFIIKGKADYKIFYELIEQETNRIVATAATKTSCLKIFRGLHDSGKVEPQRFTYHWRKIKKVINGNDIVFSLSPKISKNSKPGKYIIFYNDNN